LLAFRCVIAFVLALPVPAYAASRVEAAAVPAELKSTAFTVTANGQSVDVAHAAASYDWVSFDTTGPVNIAITAREAGFWDRGVDIQPWRLGLRPVRDGQTIRSRLTGPAKLSIGRPGDFLNHAVLLFLFAGSPPPPPPVAGPKVTISPAGIHRQSLNPKTGDTIYLAPGAFVFGSLNLFNVSGIRVLGRGTIVYEGSQDPNSDEGWMQNPDWHCIGSVNARNVQIDGLTCIVRARTWSIQMKDSRDFTFDDLRVIGGNSGNANQDGIDWLGGGDAIVRDAFLRVSDDVFALQGNWDGYTDAEMLTPGQDVENILIEHSKLSTSISNVVRSAWPRKTFNSRNFVLRDSDVLHGGIGACGQPFALLGMWGANGAKGEHSNYTFEDIFLDGWYSLVQMEQEEPATHGVTFRNIWALDQPPLTYSTLTGDVSGVTFDNVKYGQTVATTDASLPLIRSNGAPAPVFPPSHKPMARFSVDPPFFAPGQKVIFPGAGKGGCLAMGPKATGARWGTNFRMRVGRNWTAAERERATFECCSRSRTKPATRTGLLRALSPLGNGKEPVSRAAPMVAGLTWQIYPGSWTELPDLTKQRAVFHGESLTFKPAHRGSLDEQWRAGGSPAGPGAAVVCGASGCLQPSAAGRSRALRAEARPFERGGQANRITWAAARYPIRRRGSESTIRCPRTGGLRDRWRWSGPG
jgi:hypothetical protein